MNNGYIYSSEMFCLFFTGLLLFLMKIMKPQKTPLYRLCFKGTCLCIVALIIELAIGISADYSKRFYNPVSMNILLVLFIAAYSATVYNIVEYSINLASNIRFSKSNLRIFNRMFHCIYILCAVFFAVTGKLYSFEYGVFDFSLFVSYYIAFGIAGAVFISFATLINHRQLSKVVVRCSGIFVPFELLLLLIQLTAPQHIFSGITYVLPYILFYVLFHSHPFDDSTGCQNRFSFEAQILEAIKRKQKFTVSFISIPKLDAEDFSNYIGKVEIVRKIYAETCHSVEQRIPRLRIFRLTPNLFAQFYIRDDDTDDGKLLKILEQILRDCCQQVANRVYFKMFSFHENEYIDSEKKLHKISSYIDMKMGDIGESQAYVATKQDYENFARLYKLEQLLFKIRNSVDMDNPQVLLYIQPIHNVATNSFRTAEALMRLVDDDGNIIPPDVFIPIAERTGCIHALTRIILNKVCKRIALLKDEYDFDAITVNFSSAEFSNKNLYREILQIIKAHEIDTSYVRIELTESAMFEDFERVRSNMEYLGQAGIRFYLDDFGTGYSNFERIITLPFYTVKFDKSLLNKSLQDENMADLVSHMIYFFRMKGFYSLVEGVENESQLALCYEKGFDYIQGFKFAKPVPEEEISNYFKKKDTTI